MSLMLVVQAGAAYSMKDRFLIFTPSATYQCFPDPVPAHYVFDYYLCVFTENNKLSKVTPKILGFLVVGIFCPRMWISSFWFIPLVHVVRIVPVDLGAKSDRLLSANKSLSAWRFHPSMFLPTDSIVQSSEFISGGGR